MQCIKALIVSAAVVVASPALSQYIQTWDDNKDSKLSQEEWRSGLKEIGLFSKWDENNNSSISAQEFAGGLYAQFDDNDDSKLTKAEWATGFDNWYGEQAVSLDFSNWDNNGDEMLTQQEFTEAFKEQNLFTNFIRETDIATGAVGGTDTAQANVAPVGYEIAEADFADGLFGWFDEDEDGLIDADEAGFLD